eukprot:COSAG04_NODE_508_length_13301_cov_9.662198_1_plen_179_part_00
MSSPQYGGQAASQSLASTFGPDDQRGRGGAPSPLRDGEGAGGRNEDLTADPAPVSGDPVGAWGDMTTYWYIDNQRTKQGPFALAQMRGWASVGQLPPKTHVLPSNRQGKDYPSDGFVYLDSLPEIWQPSGGRGSAQHSRHHDDDERGRSPRHSDGVDDERRRDRSESSISRPPQPFER